MDMQRKLSPGRATAELALPSLSFWGNDKRHTRLFFHDGSWRVTDRLDYTVDYHFFPAAFQVFADRAGSDDTNWTVKLH